MAGGAAIDLPHLETETVEPGQLPGPYSRLSYNPEQFGGGAAEALNQVGQQVKEKADALAVTDASNKLSDRLNTILSDPQTGLFNRRGKDALTVPKDFQDAYTQAISDINGTLTDVNQKVAFQQMASQQRSYREFQIDRHVSGEMQTFANQTYETAVKNAQMLGAENADNPEILAGAMQTQRNAIMTQAHTEGWGPDMTDYMLRSEASNMHFGVVNSLMEKGELDKAQAYYDNFKDEFNPVHKSAVINALQAEETKQTAFQTASKIQADNPNDLAAQLKQVAAIPNQQVHDQVLDRIKSDAEVMKQAQEQQHTNLVKSIATDIDGGKPWQQIQSVRWMQLDAQEQEAFQKRSNQVQSGVEPPQNWNKYTDLMTQFSKDPKGFASINLMTDARPYLDNEHYQEIVKLQQAALDGKDGNKEAYTSLLEPKQRFDNTIVPIAFPGVKNPDQLTGDDKVRYGNLLSQAQDLITQQEQTEGRKLKPQEVQQVMDNFAHEQVFVHNKYFPGSDQKPLVSITKDEQGRAFVPRDQIPDAIRSNFQNYASSIKVTLTDDKLERAYAAALRNDDAAVQEILQEK